MPTPPHAIQPARHFVGLDGLRGFASLSVVFFHLGHWLDVPKLATNSGLAVDLFFCLSGYVLPLAYGNVKAPELTFRGFTRIRLIRLMPLIALAIAISCVYVAGRLTMRHEGAFYAPLAAATLLGLLVLPYFNPPTAIGGPQIFPLNGPQYSLFLELAVNAVWFATRRFPQLPFALALFAVSFALMALCGYGGDTARTFWLGFPRLFASFFIGVALYHIGQGRGRALAESRWAALLFWASCIVMAALFYMPMPAGFGITLVWVGLISPLLVFTGAKVAIGGLPRRLCLATGALSYPIYALHYPIFAWLNGIVQMRTHSQVPALEIPLAFTVIVAFSALALARYDEPLRAAVSRRLKTRRGIAPTPTAPRPALSAP